MYLAKILPVFVVLSAVAFAIQRFHHRRLTIIVPVHHSNRKR